MQTPADASKTWSTTIRKTGAEIATLQERLRVLASERARAAGQRNNAAGALQEARRQDAPAVALAAHQKALNEAEAHLQALRDEQNDLYERSYALHDVLEQTHRAARIHAALGGRVLDVALPSAATDATLDELIREHAALSTAEATLQLQLSAARTHAADAADQLQTIRVAVLRETATRDEVAAAEQAVKDASGGLATLEQDERALRAALSGVTSDQAVRAAAALAERRPALMTEYRKRLRAFTDALGAAAIANEALAVVQVALQESGGTVPVLAWKELRVRVSTSKFRDFMTAALETGYLEEQD